MKNNYSKTLIGCCASWGGLGFIRGINSYKYNYYKYETNKPYIYSRSIINGFFGIIIYANPVLIPILIYKEIYRLEINLRNLENEKKSNFYNDLL